MNEATEQYSPRASGEGSSAAVAEAPSQAAQRDGHRRLSPAVRRIAAEYRVDLDSVAGLGPRRPHHAAQHRRVHSDEEESAAATDSRSRPVRRGTARRRTRGARGASGTARPRLRSAGAVLPFTRIRKLTADHMVRSKATSPHVLQAVEVDFFRVDQVRKTLREAFKARHGHSLTYLPFIAHAVCQALHEFPNLNSSVQGDGLVIHENVNLAIAVDLGAEGLVAPVIKFANKLSVSQLASAINDVSSRARGGKLKPDDFSGGTYTLSNSGTFGTLITAPIINQPQVAILSTDGVRKKPVVLETSEGDTIAIRPVGILAQSFDHRAVDGAYSAAFLDKVRKLLENSHWLVEV